MRRFLFFALLLLATTSIFAQTTWTGTVSTAWGSPLNWNPQTVPNNSTTDVIIPVVGNGRYPLIGAASYNVRTLTIASGATLTLSSTYNLTCGDDLTTAGQINLNGSGYLTVFGDITWQSGSSLSTTSLNPLIVLSGSMYFNSGSNVVMNYGEIQFNDYYNTTIVNNSASTQLNNVAVMKPAGYNLTISASSTQNFVINGNLSNGYRSTFNNNYTGSVTLRGNLTDANPATSYGVRWDSGTLILDGSAQSLGLQSTSCYLKNLTCSQTGTATLTYPLTLKGTLRIESGVLNPLSNNITLAGNWDNTVGPDAFTEGSSARVIFNGASHQYCNYTENFNILEVNNGAALRVGGGATLTCASYDWTAGGIDVNASGGTFTASDLADNAIVGKFYVVTGGTINLTNTGGLVDLDGLVTFTGGGTINVYGGSANSTWKNVNLTMNGGTFAFHDTGIYISGSSSYTFSANITGGTISAAGTMFQCDRSTFSPTGGTVELTGASSANLYMTAGNLYNLKINKSGTATIVGLVADLVCAGNITVSQGILSLGDQTLDCAGYLWIYGKVRMDNAAATLDVGSNVVWMPLSEADITLGTIYCGASWELYNNTTVQFPTAVVTYLTSAIAKTIYVADPDARFGNLCIGRVSDPAIYSVSSTSPYGIYVQGSLVITAGSTLNLDILGMTVTGGLYLNGTLSVGSGAATVMGTMTLDAASTINIDTGSLTCTSSAVPRDTYLYGTLNINTGSLVLTNNAVTVMAGSVNNIGSGSLWCDGITAQNAGTFQPTGGTVVLGDLYGGGISPIRVTAGNWLPNLTIDAGSQGYMLKADLIIKGNLTIVTGGLDVMDSITATVYNITISGNWNNQGGTFFPRNGRVTFNGAGHQYLQYSETFNLIVCNKSGGAIRVDGTSATVTCAQYDWTAGAVDVLEGVFTASDLVDNGLYGGYYCNAGGTINLTNAGNRIDLNGILQITGGEVNIYGGSSSSYWPYAANATLTMSAGTLNFKNQGIYVNNHPTYTLTCNITGGKITTMANFTCNRTDFVPAGGIFEFVGSGDIDVTFLATGSSFNKLTVNKAPTREEEQNLVTNPTQTRAYQVNLGSNVTCRGAVLVENGRLTLGAFTLNCADNLTVRNSSTLELVSSSVLAMAGSKILSVNSGAQIDVLGSADLPAKFTHYGEGYYSFDLNSGATLSAMYAIFEFMDANGVYFNPGSTCGGLHSSAFRNGIAGGVLLRADCYQDLSMTGLQFLTNAGMGAKNVSKTSANGRIVFSAYSGVFSGSAFENDPYNRLFWTGSDVNLQITSVNWNRPDEFIGSSATVVVTIQNTGSHDIVPIVPFHLDIYKNLPTAPPAGTTGDQTWEIATLEAGQSKTYNFYVTSWVPITWTTWVRVDASNVVPETNEADNLWTRSLNIEWLALPAVTDISITPQSPGWVRVQWSYPHWCDGFRLYASTDPYFTPGPTNLIAVLGEDDTIVDSMVSGNRRFYIVTVEREQP